MTETKATDCADFAEWCSAEGEEVSAKSFWQTLDSLQVGLREAKLAGAFQSCFFDFTNVIGGQSFICGFAFSRQLTSKVSARHNVKFQCDLLPKFVDIVI
jgi:hypothetical protein